MGRRERHPSYGRVYLWSNEDRLAHPRRQRGWLALEMKARRMRSLGRTIYADQSVRDLSWG